MTEPSEDEAPEQLLGAGPWRTGRRTGRTVFDAGERLIAMFDRPDLAAQAVDAVNGERHAVDADDLLDRVLGSAEVHAALPPGLLADIRKHLGV